MLMLIWWWWWVMMMMPAWGHVMCVWNDLTEVLMWWYCWCVDDNEGNVYIMYISCVDHIVRWYNNNISCDIWNFCCVSLCVIVAVDMDWWCEWCCAALVWWWWHHHTWHISPYKRVWCHVEWSPHMWWCMWGWAVVQGLRALHTRHRRPPSHAIITWYYTCIDRYVV